jgi:uncharacterized protein YciI
VGYVIPPQADADGSGRSARALPAWTKARVAERQQHQLAVHCGLIGMDDTNPACHTRFVLGPSHNRNDDRTHWSQASASVGRSPTGRPGELGGNASGSGARPYDLAVFVVTLTYLVDLSEVDAALSEHVAWLDQQYADGVFIASGRQVPRVGGLILVAGTNREDLERRLALDPFGRLGLAEHAVVEFVPSRVTDGLEQLLR